MANVINLASIAALRAYNSATPSPVIWVEGYTNLADGGEGMFVYISGDTTSTDNAGTIIVTTAGYRYYRERNKGPLNICWFGGFLNSTSDSAPAFNSALAALPAAGGELYFPAGKFTFSSEIDYTTPSSGSPFGLSFLGDGADVSVLYWPTTAGITITVPAALQSIHFRDMSITTGQACGNNGVTITQNTGAAFGQTDFERVTFRGNATYQQYWGNAIQITGLSNVSYDTVLVYGGNNGSGNGISLSGYSSGSTSVTSIVHNISKCGFFSGSTGLVYGNNVQGITVSQSNFTNGVTGISIPSGAGTFQLAVVGCQFNTTQDQILIQGTIASLNISGSLFFVPGGSNNYAGVHLDSPLVEFITITGNSFLGGVTNPLAGTGVLTTVINGPNAIAGALTGNAFGNLAVGVNLTGAAGWSVQGNAYNNITTKVIPGAGNSVGVATD